MLDYTPGLTLSERAVSGFPLSVGTSLAFESVFTAQQTPYDPKREIPSQVELSNYDSCWVNITTLFRNLSGAVEKEVFTRSSASALAATLEEEMGVIQNLFQIEGQNLVQPVFYYSTYSHLLKKNVPSLKFRLPHTELQKFYADKLESTLKLINSHTDQIRELKDTLEPPRRERAFVLTHQPYDLVGWHHFNHLDLLESNTGILKPRAMWNTKYYPMPGESMAHLPFTKKLLLIFGDRVLIHPSLSPLRKQIIRTSIDRNWTPMTTEAKIKMDLGFDVRDPYMMAIINAL